MVEENDLHATEWYCDPPPERSPYRIVGEDWVDREGRRVRRIYIWEPA
jgi:hypothetical protein